MVLRLAQGLTFEITVCLIKSGERFLFLLILDILGARCYVEHCLIGGHGIIPFLVFLLPAGW